MSWSRAPLPDNLCAQVDWPDLMILSCTVLGEAEGEPFEGKLAIAWVVVNRSEDTLSRWPQAIGAVCLQRHQFSAWSDPRRLSAMRSPKMHTTPQVWEACFKAACAAMYKLALDPAGGANHYLQEETVVRVAGKLPSWFDRERVTAKIGAHTLLAL